MNKIVNPQEAEKIASQLKKQGKRIALVGGVFDILHSGHIFFLEQAKQYADYLFVLLECDQNVRRKKGPHRPIHSQKDRALILSSLPSVDYVIRLPEMTINQQYDKLVNQLIPSVIATTYGNRESQHKKRQAQAIGAKLVFISYIKNQSTTRMETLIKRL